MASTIEMFVAGLALITNTLIIIISYFIGNAVLGPLLKFVSEIGFKQVIPMSDITCVFPYYFAFLFIIEIILIIGFVAMIGRRAGYDYYE